MLSIGQFSLACHVSIKALRHYEKVGLLLPTRVDDWTGYRYDDARRIIANPAAGPEALRCQREVVAAQVEQQTLFLHEFAQPAHEHLPRRSLRPGGHGHGAGRQPDGCHHTPGLLRRMADAYGAMTQRLAGQNLKSNGAPYGIYLSGSGQGAPAECRTEIRFPIRMRDAP